MIAAFRFQDQIDNFSPVFCGEAGVGMPAHVKALLRDADVILAINARLGEVTTDGYTLLDVPAPRQTLIHVHPSDREIGKVCQPALGIQAGPNAFAAALGPVKGGWSDWREKGRAAWEASLIAPPQPSPVDMAAVTAHLREVLPPDVILTNGAGNFTVWPNKFFRFGPEARLLAPQSGAMGYGLPAAVAAKIACPALVVQGSRDMMTPLKGARALAAAIPKGSIQIVQGAGHMVMIERATETLEALAGAM